MAGKEVCFGKWSQSGPKRAKPGAGHAATNISVRKQNMDIKLKHSLGGASRWTFVCHTLFSNHPSINKVLC